MMWMWKLWLFVNATFFFGFLAGQHATSFWQAVPFAFSTAAAIVIRQRVSRTPRFFITRWPGPFGRYSADNGFGWSHFHILPGVVLAYKHKKPPSP